MPALDGHDELRQQIEELVLLAAVAPAGGRAEHVADRLWRDVLPA